MGPHKSNMALTMFNMHNSLFPSEAGFGGFQEFRRMDRLMEQMDRQRAGEKLSRSRRAIGQGESAKAIEETVKGEEQTRTLHNMEEQDLPAFNQQHAARLHWQPFHALEPRAEQPKHALHAALEQDIDRVAGSQ